MTFKLWSVGATKPHESHATVWRLMSFEDLRVGELYEVLRLRSEVFVVEQQCIFLDIDGDDRDANHLLGVQGEELKAYARCFGPGVKSTEASIGRVAIHPSARGKPGVGATGHSHWRTGPTGRFLCQARLCGPGQALYRRRYTPLGNGSAGLVRNRDMIAPDQ